MDISAREWVICVDAESIGPARWWKFGRAYRPLKRQSVYYVERIATAGYACPRDRCGHTGLVLSGIAAAIPGAIQAFCPNRFAPLRKPPEQAEERKATRPAKVRA